MTYNLLSETLSLYTTTTSVSYPFFSSVSLLCSFLFVPLFQAFLIHSLPVFFSIFCTFAFSASSVLCCGCDVLRRCRSKSYQVLRELAPSSRTVSSRVLVPPTSSSSTTASNCTSASSRPIRRRPQRRRVPNRRSATDRTVFTVSSSGTNSSLSSSPSSKKTRPATRASLTSQFRFNFCIFYHNLRKCNVKIV